VLNEFLILHFGIIPPPFTGEVSAKLTEGVYRVSAYATLVALQRRTPFDRFAATSPASEGRKGLYAKLNPETGPPLKLRRQPQHHDGSNSDGREIADHKAPEAKHALA